MAYSLAYVLSTLSSTFGHLARGNSNYNLILRIVGILILMHQFPRTTQLLPRLIVFILKLLVFYVAMRPYSVLGLVAMRLSRNKKMAAKTAAMLVVFSVLMSYITFPHASNVHVEEGWFEQQYKFLEYALVVGDAQLSGDRLEAVLAKGLALPSSIDALKCVCLLTLMLAAYKQSNTNPKKTLMDALLS